MNAKNAKIELPFDYASLLTDLKEIKTYLSEIDEDTSEEFENEIVLLKGVIENLEEIIKGVKDPETMDQRTKISLLAHFTLFQELMDSWDDEDLDDDFEDFDDEFDESELEEDTIEK